MVYQGDQCGQKTSATLSLELSDFTLKTKERPEYQINDGPLVECGGGETTQLVFQFVRNDGTYHQWSEILQSCL